MKKIPILLLLLTSIISACSITPKKHAENIQSLYSINLYYQSRINSNEFYTTALAKSQIEKIRVCNDLIHDSSNECPSHETECKDNGKFLTQAQSASCNLEPHRVFCNPSYDMNHQPQFIVNHGTTWQQNNKTNPSKESLSMYKENYENGGCR